MLERQANDVFGDLIRATFGSHGMGPAERFFGVANSSVRRWCDGSRPIPAAIWTRVLSEAQERKEQLTTLIDESRFHDA